MERVCTCENLSYITQHRDRELASSVYVVVYNNTNTPVEASWISHTPGLPLGSTPQRLNPQQTHGFRFFLQPNLPTSIIVHNLVTNAVCSVEVTKSGIYKVSDICAV